MPAPIKVLLVDDQMLVREGIKSLLNLSDKVEVVGEAQDGTEIENALAVYSPDVILLDLSMPKMDGIATLNWLAENKVETPVIILTTFDDHEFILRGIQAGAMGYLLKDVSLETLIRRNRNCSFWKAINAAGADRKTNARLAGI